MKGPLQGASESLSRVDTAWLRMDSDRNLMMIVGVWLLRPALDLAALRQRLQSRLLRYARFRQKVVRDAVLSHWVDDEEFDLERHVIGEKLGRQRGQTERQALQARTSELAATRLDPAHPLWQMHVLERYGAGNAVIFRIHHCIADGVALNAVLLSIMDGGTDLHPSAAADGADGADGDWLAESVVRPVKMMTLRTLSLYGQGMAQAMEYLKHPQQPLSDAADLVGAGARVLRDAAALALLPDDSPTRLKGALSGRKVVAWCEPLPLEPVKAAGKALGCSVNDVLLSCVAGSIGHYLRQHGEDPAGQEVRAMVPVNLRPPSEAWQLGNRFGLAPLVLPIGIENPIERLYAVRERMREFKLGYQPLLAYGVLAVAGLLTQALQDALTNLFLKKTTAVITNLEGLKKPVRMCGSTVRQSIFWVPTAGEVGLGVSIVSYMGGVQFGLMTDSLRCPDPQKIIDRFGPEFESLLLLTLMLPWAVEAGTRKGSGPWAPPTLPSAA